LWKLACDYPADYPMVIYARTGAASLDGMLAGPGPVSAGYEYVKPLFQIDERRAMVEPAENPRSIFHAISCLWR
jgi:hypothetical protein